MKTTIATTLTVLAAVAFPLATHAQNLLTNGSFEQHEFFIERDGFPRLDDVNGSAPTGWTRDSGTLAEYMTRLPAYLGLTIYNPADGDYFIGPHDGEWWEQTFATIPGASYELTYWSAYGAAWADSFYYRPGSSPGLVTVTGDAPRLSAPLIGTSPAPDGETLLDSPFVWSRHTETFTADSSFSTLRFAGPDVPDGGYIFVDNVSVVAVPPRLKIRFSEVELCWDTVSNETYRVEYRPNVEDGAWTLLECVLGNGRTKLIYDKIPVDAPRRFYRLAVTNCVPGF